MHHEYPEEMKDEISGFLKGAANSLRKYILLHLNPIYEEGRPDSAAEIAHSQVSGKLSDKMLGGLHSLNLVWFRLSFFP